MIISFMSNKMYCSKMNKLNDELIVEIILYLQLKEIICLRQIDKRFKKLIKNWKIKQAKTININIMHNESTTYLYPEISQSNKLYKKEILTLKGNRAMPHIINEIAICHNELKLKSEHSEFTQHLKGITHINITTELLSSNTCSSSKKKIMICIELCAQHPERYGICTSNDKNKMYIAYSNNIFHEATPIYRIDSRFVYISALFANKCYYVCECDVLTSGPKNLAKMIARYDNTEVIQFIKKLSMELIFKYRK